LGEERAVIFDALLPDIDAIPTDFSPACDVSDPWALSEASTAACPPREFVGLLVSGCDGGRAADTARQLVFATFDPVASPPRRRKEEPSA
jgi:hypothetical protein